MLLDATLAYLHFAAILAVAGFLVAEAMLLRGDLGARDVGALSRADVWYFNAAGLVSIKPTMAFIRWRRAARAAAGYSVPDAEVRGARRLVLVELHLLALIPLAAVLMARGIGH